MFTSEKNLMYSANFFNDEEEAGEGEGRKRGGGGKEGEGEERKLLFFKLMSADAPPL